MAKDEKLRKIKTGLWSRSLSLAKLTVNTGASLTGVKVGGLFQNAEEKAARWALFIKGRAQEFSQELGDLKGSLMKAGQMLSMYGEYFLPPEANELLKTLQSASKPLEWRAIESYLKKYLPTEKLSELDIDIEPIGTASLGQVHRARVKATGEEIVLKIQYPGVDRAIQTDLKALRAFLKLSKVLPPGEMTDSLFAEIQAMLEQETDYRAEARQTQKYAQLLGADERFVIPHVLERWSNDRVLATSYEPGVRVDSPEVQSLPQARRDALGRHFLDLYFREIFEWKFLQTDPHLGNYQIRLDPRANDQIILYDFGATRVYEDAFMIPYYRMMRAALENDREALRKASAELGFIHEDDSPLLKKLFEEFCVNSVEPFLTPDDPRVEPGVMDAEGRYDWKKSTLPRRLSQTVTTMMKQFALRSPPREIIFLDRKTGGVFIFLAVLGAKICGRDLLLSRLPPKN